jgi:hypothetical protein
MYNIKLSTLLFCYQIVLHTGRNPGLFAAISVVTVAHLRDSAIELAQFIQHHVHLSSLS